MNKIAFPWVQVEVCAKFEEIPSRNSWGMTFTRMNVMWTDTLKNTMPAASTVAGAEVKKKSDVTEFDGKRCRGVFLILLLKIVIVCLACSSRACLSKNQKAPPHYWFQCFGFTVLMQNQESLLRYHCCCNTVFSGTADQISGVQRNLSLTWTETRLVLLFNVSLWIPISSISHTTSVQKLVKNILLLLVWSCLNCTVFLTHS